MTEESVTRGPTPSAIESIAIVDDDLAPLTTEQLVDDNSQLLPLTSVLDEAGLLDLERRGFAADALASTADQAIDSLSDPSQPLGDAYACISEASTHFAEMIAARRNVRALVEDIRSICNSNVAEFVPQDAPEDFADYQLILLDCFLVRGSDDTELAEEIARRAAQTPDFAVHGQLILMSSLEKARALRRDFRREAGVAGTAFLFVAKSELDAPWKIRAHLNMLEWTRPQSALLAGYINTVKESLRAAASELSGQLDELDLSDFAHVQNLALLDDGHPLGEYLSWLFSSHLRSLAFERDLRPKENQVDALTFEGALVAPARPSHLITSFHHSAVFVRNLGPLRPHPRSRPGEDPDIPLARLGDVFLDDGPSRAIVILSADCDLSFAPSRPRSTPRSDAVLLVPGEPQLLRTSAPHPDTPVTEGVEHDLDVLRIDWLFHRYETVSIRDLEEYLTSNGYRVDRYERLTPLYALQLQRAFANRVFRIGSPATPPVTLRLNASVVQWSPVPQNSVYQNDIFCSFTDDQISAYYFDRSLRFRITPHIAGCLRDALSDLLPTLRHHLDGLADKAHTNFEHKLRAIERLLDDHQKWADLLGDRLLGGEGSRQSLCKSVYLSVGTYEALNQPAVVLHIEHPEPDSSS